MEKDKIVLILNFFLFFYQFVYNNVFKIFLDLN